VAGGGEGRRPASADHRVLSTTRLPVIFFINRAAQREHGRVDTHTQTHTYTRARAFTQTQLTQHTGTMPSPASCSHTHTISPIPHSHLMKRNTHKKRKKESARPRLVSLNRRPPRVRAVRPDRLAPSLIVLAPETRRREVRGLPRCCGLVGRAGAACGRAPLRLGDGGRVRRARLHGQGRHADGQGHGRSRAQALDEGSDGGALRWVG
jgi:hypothetical protein